MFIRARLLGRIALNIKPPLLFSDLTKFHRPVASMTGMMKTGKRSASSSPSKDDSKVVKKVFRDQDIIHQDSFDDDVDFDADALLDATLAAEEEDIRIRSSQPSGTPVNGAGGARSNGNVKSSVPQSPSINATKQSTLHSAFSSPSSSNKTTSLSHGDPDVEKETMDAEWYERLSKEMTKEYFVKLKQFLRTQVEAKKKIYPPAHLIHSWSRLTPLSTVKVVVVGQDPYHGPGQACGHSFSVPKGVAVPGSLKNIYKELVNEYGTGFVPPKHGCLDGWAKQGVLLLNACLTVEAGMAGSHHNKGWEPFTQTILKAIAEDAAKAPKSSIKNSTIASMFGKAALKQGVDSKSTTATKEKEGETNSSSSSSKGVVFLAWGLPAAKTLAEAGITEKSSNILLLKSAHPSPLSAHRGFLGNGHFKKANEWLESDTRYGPGGGIEWDKL